jgi:amino acid adenylation domain-containing protein
VSGTSAVARVEPASSGERRLWLLDRLYANLRAYNLASAVWLQGELDRERLLAAVRGVTGRHPALRSTFELHGERLMRRIAPSDVGTPQLVDAAGWSDEKVSDRLQLMAATPFDLSKGPLFRAVLLASSPTEHVLVLAAHHSICDGWSMNVLFREVLTAYSSADHQAGLDDHSMNGHGRPEPAAEDRAYWNQQLADLEPFELNSDHPRPRIRTFSGARKRLRLDATMTAELIRFARSEGTTPFAALVALIAAFLGRYGGRSEVVIGTIVAGRPRPELEDTVGFLANTVVLRLRISTGTTLRQLLQSARRVVGEALAHGEYPFAALVEELRPERDPARQPFFQIGLGLNPPARLPDIPSLSTRLEELDPGSAKFDLTFEFTRSDDALSGFIEYATELFDVGSIERMARNLGVFLGAALREPDRLLATVDLIHDHEHRLLTEWNRTEAPYPERCVHELIAERAALRPDAVAVVASAGEVTYAELERRSAQLARYLVARGVGPGWLVGHCIDRSADAIVGLLGILKAGAAYVPLDPTYPRGRIAFMLGDAKLRVVVTQERHLGLLSDDTEAVCLDRDGAAIATQPTTAPISAVGPDDLAYVIYTSGSTGTPKGVLATHRATVNRLAWMARTFPFREDERALQRTPLSFVDSIAEILGPLAEGVSLVVLSDDDVRDPARLLRQLEREEITRLVVVPSLLRALLATGGFDHSLTRRQLWVCSGETLELSLVRVFGAALPGARLVNLYGSSEVAADVCHYEVRDIDRLDTVPIGRPIANTQLHVLDEARQLVPIGVVGELYVGGVGVARGYLGRPDLTAERFLPDPFSVRPDGRMYRTGDLARWRADGQLEYLGRRDDQVKVRGFRVELGEIETTLRSHPAVREAAVIAREAGAGQRQLVAYFVPRGEPPAAEALRDFLAARLPAYMVPAPILLAEELPLNPSGKVDRRALAARDLPLSSASSSALPQSALECTLAALWCELLGVAQVGVDDNFFELGGDSLVAVHLVTRIRSATDIHMSALDVFEWPTIRELAGRYR